MFYVGSRTSMFRRDCKIQTLVGTYTDGGRGVDVRADIVVFATTMLERFCGRRLILVGARRRWRDGNAAVKHAVAADCAVASAQQELG